MEKPSSPIGLVLLPIYLALAIIIVLLAVVIRTELGDVLREVQQIKRRM